MKTFDEMLRDSDRIWATEYGADFTTPNANGWVENWHCRLVYETPHAGEPGDEAYDRFSRTPIIEFYSLDTNQFVSSYYVDTFLGIDPMGNGYGHGLWLWADVPAWQIGASDADEIRDWCVEALRNLDGDYPFELPW